MTPLEPPDERAVLYGPLTESRYAHASSGAEIGDFVQEGLNCRMNAHKEDDIRNFLYGQEDNSQFLHGQLSSYKGCMDVVRKLIDERIKALGLDYADVSRRIGRNVAYIQQFLKKGSPRELHERDRHLLAEILKVSEERLRGPSTTLPKRSYEKKPGSLPQSSLDDAMTAPHGSKSGTPAVVVPNSTVFGNQLDLPVFGTAQGGQDGALIVSELAVDYVARPPALLRVRDGYGMIVSGDSMSPEHKEGSIALVNPHLPPRVGDSCVFRSHADDGTNLAMIKEYRGQTETLWKVHQHNPPRDFTLKKSDWQVCHRTIGNYFP